MQLQNTMTMGHPYLDGATRWAVRRDLEVARLSFVGRLSRLRWLCGRWLCRSSWYAALLPVVAALVGEPRCQKVFELGEPACLPSLEEPIVFCEADDSVAVLGGEGRAGWFAWVRRIASKARAKVIRIGFEWRRTLST